MRIVTGYFCIMVTIICTVYGQLAIKWQMAKLDDLPHGVLDKLSVLTLQLLNPWVFTGFVSAFIAALAWMAALTRFDLSYAYPFMSISFFLVMILSTLLFQEPITFNKMVGMLLVIGGIIIGSR